MGPWTTNPHRSVLPQGGKMTDGIWASPLRFSPLSLRERVEKGPDGESHTIRLSSSLRTKRAYRKKMANRAQVKEAGLASPIFLSGKYGWLRLC